MSKRIINYLLNCILLARLLEGCLGAEDPLALSAHKPAPIISGHCSPCSTSVSQVKWCVYRKEQRTTVYLSRLWRGHLKTANLFVVYERQMQSDITVSSTRAVQSRALMLPNTSDIQRGSIYVFKVLLQIKNGQVCWEPSPARSEEQPFIFKDMLNWPNPGSWACLTFSELLLSTYW